LPQNSAFLVDTIKLVANCDRIFRKGFSSLINDDIDLAEQIFLAEKLTSDAPALHDEATTLQAGGETKAN
jgi:hypothetical protein